MKKTAGDILTTQDARLELPGLGSPQPEAGPGTSAGVPQFHSGDAERRSLQETGHPGGIPPLRTVNGHHTVRDAARQTAVNSAETMTINVPLPWS